MSLAVVGVSHHTAPVEIRERMAFAPSEASQALMTLRREVGVQEAVLLSTCNRTEVYLFPAERVEVVQAWESMLEAKAGRIERRIRDYLFEQRGDGVVRHLFQVSAGLDSLVTGEAEIQGQVREAYERAVGMPVDPPLAGPVLNRLFQMALSVGGQVRAETPIGQGAASAASVAVKLARKIFGSLKGKRVLIVGAGQTGELIVQALHREGAQGITVVNRTYERAAHLARQVHGQALEMERLAEGLSGVDIVLSSTAAPHPVLTREVFRHAFPSGLRRPLLVIDIAIPRDVDPVLGDESGVFLYNVDDLRKIVDEQVRLREGAIPEADRIIRAQHEEFRTWYASLEVVPVIRTMRDRADEFRTSELERLLRGMDHLSDRDRARLEEFSHRLMNKLLHDPTVRLRKGIRSGGGSRLVEAARFLYGMEDHEHPDSESGKARASEDGNHGRAWGGSKETRGP
ncbi:MAG: glutamyl-tRNA reductase [Gemmatimonadales bacterium]|nr:MAG: glutamyl-tRNA reductase [Gemmatimonadales bacterium]